MQTMKKKKRQIMVSIKAFKKERVFLKTVPKENQ